MNKFSAFIFSAVIVAVVVFSGCNLRATINSNAPTTAVPTTAPLTTEAKTEAKTEAVTEKSETEDATQAKDDDGEQEENKILISSDEACSIIDSLYNLNDDYKYSTFCEIIEDFDGEPYYKVEVRRTLLGIAGSEEYVTSYYVAADGTDYINAG